ncbi:MAG: TetR/AcrR family transcriptional regulator C-terminal domain-containing protein [Actinomycetota bacterium]
MPKETPRRGRKPSLNRAMIGDAALDVGFEKITLTAVAERLGISHAGLYTYVADRNDLVTAAAEQLAESMAWPEPGPDWEAFLRAEGDAMYRAMFTHPGLVAALDDAQGIPDNFRQHLADVHGHLIELGFDPEKAFHAMDVVFDLASYTAESAARIVRRSPEGRQQLSEAWSAGYEDGLRKLMMNAVMDEPITWFEAKLDIVIAGIRATLAPEGT